MEHAYAAQALLEAGDARGAVTAAAEAASAWPSDVPIAHLYVAAAERARDIEHRVRSYEHLLRLIEPDVRLLIALADCQATSGALAAARDAARQARAIFPRRLRDRQRWLRTLEAIEREAGTAPAASGGAGAEPATLPLFPSPVRPAAARAAPAPPSPAPRRAAVTAEAQPQPSSAPAEPPPAFGIPIAVDPAIAGIEALARAEWSTPEAVRLSVLATRVRDAESFETLLAVERARGLLRLSHQEETARKVLTVLLGRALLADEVGLGKTVEAGLVLSEYLLRGRVARALVLAPPSLVRQWREELAAKFDIATRTTEDAEARRDPTAFWSGAGVVVASLATARAPQQRDRVSAAPWDLVIVDEAHTLKNARTQSHALVARLTARFLLLLTATPVENDVEELYTLVSLLRPGHLGGRADFVRRLGGRGGRPSEAARREVRALLSEVMVRNTRALSGVRLPPRFARTVMVEPAAAEAALYGHLLAALRAVGPAGRSRLLLSTLLQEAGSSPAALAATLARLQTADELPAAARAALAPAIAYAETLPDTAKGQALVRALGDGDGAVIVFTRFRATLAFLAELLTRRGVAAERIDGATPMPLRHAAIERLRQRGGVLLSTDVGSEGLNLQFCHRLVNFDLPWNPMRIEQRIGRLHRIGQEHAVEVVTLCLAGSIEARMLRILDERINLFELVVGEVEMILGYLEEEGSFAERVLDAFASDDETRREHELARLGDGLAEARRRYQKVTAYDEALFRNELGV
ncbi:MAG TPA: SNF2-related protein [Candidatus Dormibacteraeota bacterium]|nr:SNF2-related protein [Candidatus Dormibacteraeota bacterium]